MSIDLPAPDAIERVIHTYLRAKDGNRPHLMREAFAEKAQLDMLVKTDSIAFPATSNGLAGISEVLVRKFGQTYENVYTFCLQRPTGASRSFSCDWLVGMSDKASGAVRVGCGRYDWTIGKDQRAEHLLITIEAMQVLAADNLDAVSSWLAALPYPWCSSGQALATAPAIDALEPVLGRLRLNALS